MYYIGGNWHKTLLYYRWFICLPKGRAWRFRGLPCSWQHYHRICDQWSCCCTFMDILFCHSLQPPTWRFPHRSPFSPKRTTRNLVFSDYQSPDPIAVVAIFIICILAVISTKASSRVNNVASIVHFIVISLSSLPALQQPSPKTTPHLLLLVLEACSKLQLYYSSPVLDLMPFQLWLRKLKIQLETFLLDLLAQWL